VPAFCCFLYQDPSGSWAGIIRHFDEHVYIYIYICMYIEFTRQYRYRVVERLTPPLPLCYFTCQDPSGSWDGIRHFDEIVRSHVRHYARVLVVVSSNILDRYIYIYIYVYDIYICIYIHIYNSYICTYVYIHTHICIHIFTIGMFVYRKRERARERWRKRLPALS